MGKSTGFLDYKREEETMQAEQVRLKDFRESHMSLDVEQRRKQGARCMNCGVPFCQSTILLKGMTTGCPLHNLIPEWNDEIYRGHDRHALSRLLKTNNFPEFTGRVCPALCEKSCINGMDGEPVTIHDNERFLIERGFDHGWVKPMIPEVRSGKHVAVVGSGPAGLAVADQLNHRGHQVTVFERDDRVGGLLMYGIPNMKLEKNVILRRVRLMEEEGVVFRTGVNVGKDLTADQLLKSFDAVVLACGAKKPRSLSVKNADQVQGLYYAVDFLKSNTKSLLDKRDKYGASADVVSTKIHARTRGGEKADFNRPEEGSYISARDRHVVIVGGGDTGNDCLGTCIRQGAASVVQLEMMPEPPLSRLPSNPWPGWPRVKKTDYGQEEAIAVFGKDPRVYQTTVKDLHTDGAGRLKEIVTVEVQFANGKLEEVKGTEQTLTCDLLLIAAGFIGCEDYVAHAFSLKRGSRGTAVTKENGFLAVTEAEKKPAVGELKLGPKEAGGKKPKLAREEAVKGQADSENPVTKGSGASFGKVFAAGDMHRGQSLVVWAIAEGRACAKEVDRCLMGYTNL